MTRFARAKGSKSSNEKNPEDSTPWEVMKEQLLRANKDKDDVKNRKEAEKQRIENYENFLKEQKIQKRKATWCEFPESEGNIQSTNTPLKKKKKHKQKFENTETQITEAPNISSIVEDTNLDSKKVKKQSKKKKDLSKFIPQEEQAEEKKWESQNIDNTPTQIIEQTNKTVVIENKNSNSVKKSHKKKNKSKFVETQEQDDKNETNYVDSFVANEINTPSAEKSKSKKNQHVNNQSSESISNLIQISSNVSKSNEENDDYNNSHNKSVQSVKKKKGKKLVNGKPVRRKDVNDRSFQLIINGKEIELVKVDGFPVMKKDAERLQELKTSMMQKGIPKSEIQRTMKLERRRAEKALARIKRDVCYNCRKGGHNLSDCPELKSKIPGAEVGEGICFKCGSTEHRQFECKVQRDKEFRFATCFICKEPGHIARQCPDNPKGLYPNGGCCKLCGDVTHLRKDCPTVAEKKVEKSIKLSTFVSSGDVEGIDQMPEAASSEEKSKKTKKIKF